MEIFRFVWVIFGEFWAFWMKMDYVIQGGEGIWALKMDFGFYKKIQ